MTFDELLAAHLPAVNTLTSQRLLDDVLCGDSGVVGAEYPLRVLAAHAVVANQRVLDRTVERMTHVKCAGHVRRRNRDRVVVRVAHFGVAVEEAGVEPALHHQRLGLSRLETCFLSEVRHGG